MIFFVNFYHKVVNENYYNFQTASKSY